MEVCSYVEMDMVETKKGLVAEEDLLEAEMNLLTEGMSLGVAERSLDLGRV